MWIYRRRWKGLGGTVNPEWHDDEEKVAVRMRVVRIYQEHLRESNPLWKMRASGDKKDGDPFHCDNCGVKF